MAVLCPKCKKQYDVTLFQFGKSVQCDCGATVRMEMEQAPPSQGKAAPDQDSADEDRDA